MVNVFVNHPYSTHYLNESLNWSSDRLFYQSSFAVLIHALPKTLYKNRNAVYISTFFWNARQIWLLYLLSYLTTSTSFNS